ncbi:CHAP domain-containing protein [Arthrobacter sp. zg-Y1110]|uniref:CHAP domain-containing protein n=1 Tax=Arthrobacter sp. zg-Y1110 TaxID=2886932 RepID=UPI001D14ADFA|nr:CHAP domain-containing protein [Arthrobacter sp. zg-Y1110]MCC3292823.1 CHAP domain-containing protein [Arthrobacter sp. zg-Y1110]UWX86762.1 CHAP domain-containing protein [Arthrobacter sp. zg-Y1110]
MSTPDPQHPNPSGAPTNADQAKADGMQAALLVAKGAATGGAAGAAKGVAEAALKTKTGRKGIMFAALIPVVAILIVTVMIISMLNTGSNDNSAVNAGHASSAIQAGMSDVADEDKFATISDSAEKYAVRWEVMAAIATMAENRTAGKGVGPYGIDMDKVDGGISEEDAGDLTKAGNYLASKLSDASELTVDTLDNPALDAGVMDVRGTDTDGPGRKLSEEDEMLAAHDAVKEQYLIALRTLPIKGNPDISEKIFDLAYTWATGQTQQCTTEPVKLGGQTSVELNEKQKLIAQQIINQVAKKGMSEQAAVIALATAMQESTLRNWWNIRVPGSEALTDDKTAKGQDGYSVGPFQQQVNGNQYSWGTVEDAMNIGKSADMFLERLKTIPDWETMPVSNAAQAVQVSAFPDAYAKWEDMARQLVKDLKPTGGSFKDPHEDSDEGAGTPNKLVVNPDAHPNTRAVEAAIKDKYADGVETFYDLGGTLDHLTGRAVDVMIRDYQSPAGDKAGDTIADFLIKNDEAFGIDYIIWQDRIWLGPIEGWKPYSTGGYGGMYAGNWNDTTLHNDHVHVSVTQMPGTGGDYVYEPVEGAGPACATGGAHGIAVGDGGEGDDYPYKNPVGDCAWCEGSADPGADPWSLYKRECVSFVAWRMNQQMGWEKGQDYPFTPSKMGVALFGNAAEWSSNLAGAGYVTDDIPKAGAIAWWGPGWQDTIFTGYAGHVAVVKEVHDDGTVTIEQYNAAPKEHAYSVQRINATAVQGYIHVADTDK